MLYRATFLLLATTLGADALRLPARTIDRRGALSTSAAAGLSVALGPLPASAKITGSNPAAPGYSIAVLEHGCTSYKAWEKNLRDNFMVDGALPLPPDMEIIRCIFGKTKPTAGEPAKEGVMCTLVFKDSGLKAVQAFYDQGPKRQPVWDEGRDKGWLIEPFHANYYQPRLFRGAEPGPPKPLKKGMGMIYGGHGIPGKFGAWAEGFTSPGVDDFHDSLNIVASVAGPSLGKISTDVTSRKGIGAWHATKTYKDALKFLDAFQPLASDLKKSGDIIEPIRVQAAEVTLDFLYPGDPNYKGA